MGPKGLDRVQGAGCRVFGRHPPLPPPPEWLQRAVARSAAGRAASDPRNAAGAGFIQREEARNDFTSCVVV